MSMSPSHEAAAFWGSAENQAYPLEDRLAMALQALKFFGGETERLQEMVDAIDARVLDLRAKDGKSGVPLAVEIHSIIHPDPVAEWEKDEDDDDDDDT